MSDKFTKVDFIFIEERSGEYYVARCHINCTRMSDEEVWELALKFFEKLSNQANRHSWQSYKQDIFLRTQPLLCEGELSIGMTKNRRFERELTIYTHLGRFNRKILNRFKEAVDKILAPY